MRSVSPLFIAVWLLATLPGVAADWYVDNRVGDDTYTGGAKTVAGQAGPLRTMRKALQMAKPGDTVHLNPTGVFYRDQADFYNLKGGEAGKPLTLDGQGATLSGADLCPAEGWTLWKDGIYQRSDRASQVILVINGQRVYERATYDLLKPGELCYAPTYYNYLLFSPPTGKKAAECTVEVGLPDGTAVTLDAAKWTPSPRGGVVRYGGLKPPTWVKLNGAETSLVTNKDRLQPGEWCQEGKALYLFPPAGTALKDCTIECVVRDSGVRLGGATAWVTVKNLTARHFFNDGYNIHGQVTHAEFYNCNAFQCGDEGFSAHETCETLLDGGILEECDNGIFNVNVGGFSITRNVVIRNNRTIGYAVEGKGTPRHEVVNTLLIDNPNQFGGANLTLENVLIVKTPAGQRCAGIGVSGINTLRKDTVIGTTPLLDSRDPGAKITVEKCLFAGHALGMHLRMDDPFAGLKLTDVVFTPGVKVESGAKYPWKSQAVQEWVTEAQGKGSATRTVAQDCAGLEALFKGALPTGLPEGIGCDVSLYKRFLELRPAGR